MSGLTQGLTHCNLKTLYKQIYKHNCQKNHSTSLIVNSVDG